MQTVVGETVMFLDIAISYPGSMHDTRVLRQSNIFRKVESGDILSSLGAFPYFKWS